MPNLNTGAGVLRRAQQLGKTMWVTYERGYDKTYPENQPTRSWHKAWSQAKEVDEAHVFFYDTPTVDLNEDAETGWAYLVMGNDPEETLSDYSVRGEQDKWIDDYFEESMARLEGVS